MDLGLGLQQVDQFRDGLGGDLVGIDDEDVGQGRDQRNRCEGGIGIERQLLVERRVDRVGADRAHAQRVAVRRGARHLGGAKVAAGARLVFDQEALAQRLVQLVADHAGEGVGVAAGGERNDDCDRFVGIAGRLGMPARQGGDGGEQQRRQGAGDRS